MAINFNHKTKALILIMSAIVFFAVILSNYHYKRLNAANDPRVVPARLLYEEFNNYAEFNDYAGVFALLDSIENIYSQYPHYIQSYEIGVVNNNRAAALLSLGLLKDSASFKVKTNPVKHLDTDSLFALAAYYAHEAVNVYDAWLQKFGSLSEEDISREIEKDFYIGFMDENEQDREKYFKTRLKEMKTAQYETKRRLSVVYTNLGVIARYRENYEQAADYYRKAIDLWDRNLSAENNLNRLLGKPLKKRNLIQKLFPASKKD